jgi:hypothetical protein
MYNISLVTENAKELHDYIMILNNISKKIDIKVNLVLLNEIYFDKKQKEIISNIDFNHEILEIDNIYNKPFKEYSSLEKIKLVWNIQNKMFDFIKDSQILLSGVQTVFQRVLYTQIKKNKLNINTIVYHRHLLFDDKVNTSSSKIVHNKFIYGLLSLLNLDGFLIEKKAIDYADNYMVLGDINEKYLLHQGISKNKIYKVGSLEYDNIEHIKNNPSKKICYITSACEWIGDFEGEEYQKQKIKNFLKYCEKEHLKDIIIRLHPREDFAKYENLKKLYPFIQLQYPSNTKLLEDLSEFEIIVGGFSTVLFEVMLIDKRVVFYTLEKEKYRYIELIKDFSISHITNIENLFKINSNINNNNFITYNKNEKALDRISKLIIGFLNDK